MAIQGMNHFTVLTGDLDATLAFYCGVLNLRDGPRPPLGFPGAWLYCGEQAVLHIIAGRPLPAEPAGVLDHMAFTAHDLLGTITRLKGHKIEYVLRRQAGAGTWQMFFHDPSGAQVVTGLPAVPISPFD